MGDRRGPEGTRRTVETNFFGPLRVTEALLPLLNDGATITNVTSGLGALANLADPRRRQVADPGLTRERLMSMGTMIGGQHEKRLATLESVTRAAARSQADGVATALRPAP